MTQSRESKGVIKFGSTFAITGNVSGKYYFKSVSNVNDINLLLCCLNRCPSVICLGLQTGKV